MRTIIALSLVLACCGGTEPVVPTDGGSDDGGQEVGLSVDEFCERFVPVYCRKHGYCWGQVAWDSCLEYWDAGCPSIWYCVDVVERAIECLEDIPQQDCSGLIDPESCRSPCP